jgi:PEP-CTERM motif-containing protein
LLALLGNTGYYGGSASAGILSDTTGPSHYLGLIYLNGVSYLVDQSLTPGGGPTADEHDPTYGSFLVRASAVPEPASLVIFGTSLLVAGAFGRRRKKGEKA